MVELPTTKFRAVAAKAQVVGSMKEIFDERCGLA